MKNSKRESSIKNPKRPHQEFKTPVAILDYMQGVLCVDDYRDLQECVFEHDRHLTRTQQSGKKHISDTFLYTKSCSLIFSDLHATLAMHCEFMYALNRCLDVSLLVAEIMMHHVPDDVRMHDNDEHPEGLSKSTLLEQGIVAITHTSNARLRADKEMISDTNSQLRFAMRYKTLVRILHLSRGSEEGNVVTNVAETMDKNGKKSNSGPDDAIDVGFRGSNAYETLKNKCMLGAIIKYTVRSKERLHIQRSSTKIHGLVADTAARVAHIEGEVVKKATAMLQTTHCLSAKKERLALAMRKTTTENGLLQSELDSVQAKLTQMHK